jgi:hypothetical protein
VIAISGRDCGRSASDYETGFWEVEKATDTATWTYNALIGNWGSMSGYPTNRALDIWLFRGYHPINLSRGPEVSAGMSRRHSWIAPVACAAIAITLLFWFYLSRYRADQRAVTSAQDEVYEAVVRDMVSPTNGQAEMHQLVFDDTVQTGLMSGAMQKPAKNAFASNYDCWRTARLLLILSRTKSIASLLAVGTMAGYEPIQFRTSLRSFALKAHSLEHSTLTFLGFSLTAVPSFSTSCLRTVVA